MTTVNSQQTTLDDKIQQKVKIRQIRMEAPQAEKNNVENEGEEEVDEEEEEEDEEGASTNGDKDEDEKTQLEGWACTQSCQFCQRFNTFIFVAVLMIQASMNHCKFPER